jgi:hypothetical protein
LVESESHFFRVFFRTLWSKYRPGFLRHDI